MSKPLSRGSSASFFNLYFSSLSSSHFSRFISSEFSETERSEIMNKSGKGINNNNAQASIESPPDLTKLLAEDNINRIIIIQDTVIPVRLMCVD